MASNRVRDVLLSPYLEVEDPSTSPHQEVADIQDRLNDLFLTVLFESKNSVYDRAKNVHGGTVVRNSDLGAVLAYRRQSVMDWKEGKDVPEAVLRTLRILLTRVEENPKVGAFRIRQKEGGGGIDRNGMFGPYLEVESPSSGGNEFAQLRDSMNEAIRSELAKRNLDAVHDRIFHRSQRRVIRASDLSAVLGVGRVMITRYTREQVPTPVPALRVLRALKTRMDRNPEQAARLVEKEIIRSAKKSGRDLESILEEESARLSVTE